MADGGCCTESARLLDEFQPVLAMPLIGFRSCKIRALNAALHHSDLLCHPDARARSMHRIVAIDTSPPSARWMKDTLVRSAFHRTIPVVAARLPPAKTGPVLKSEAMRG
jgi:hypothetical protein